MRTTLLIVVLALLSLTPAFAQPQIIMQNEDVTTWTQRSYDVSIAPDRSVAQVFRAYEWPGEILYLRNIDESGTELWRVAVDSIDDRHLNYRRALVETLWDGSIVVALSVNNDRNLPDLRRDIVIKRYAVNGALMWTYDTHNGWPATDKYLCDLTILGRDTIAVAGFVDNWPRMKYFLKLDAMSGHQIGFVSMEGGSTHRITADITDSTVVYAYPAPGLSHPSIVSKYTHSGELRWTYEVENGQAVSVSQASDGSVYAIAHDNYYAYSRMMFDPDGTLLWRIQERYSDGKHGTITWWKDGLAILYWNGGTVELCDDQGQIQWSNELLDFGGIRHRVVVVAEDELLFGYSDWDYGLDIHLLGVVQYWIPDQAIEALNAGLEDADCAEATLTTATTLTPAQFNVGSAYPNPFNSSTTLTLTTPTAGPVRIAVSDILGRQVDSWSVPASGAGVVPITWTAHDLASGVYVIQLLTPDGHRATQRVTLIR